MGELYTSHTIIGNAKKLLNRVLLHRMEGSVDLQLPDQQTGFPEQVSKYVRKEVSM